MNDRENITPVVRKNKEVVVKTDEPPVKGGCGHTDAEVQFSGMVAGIGFLILAAAALAAAIIG